MGARSPCVTPIHVQNMTNFPAFPENHLKLHHFLIVIHEKYHRRQIFHHPLEWKILQPMQIGTEACKMVMFPWEMQSCSVVVLGWQCADWRHGRSRETFPPYTHWILVIGSGLGCLSSSQLWKTLEWLFYGRETGKVITNILTQKMHPVSLTLVSEDGPRSKNRQTLWWLGSQRLQMPQSWTCTQAQYSWHHIPQNQTLRLW